MLCLARKPGESILVGDVVRVVVNKIRGQQVSLAIDAPDDVPVDRMEIRILQELNRDAPYGCPPLTVDETERAVRAGVRDLIRQLFGESDEGIRAYTEWFRARMGIES